MKKLPSIKEDEEGSGSEDENSPLPKMPPPSRPGRGLRSPLLSARTFRLASNRTRPASLQIPGVSFSCQQPDLSPR